LENAHDRVVAHHKGLQEVFIKLGEESGLGGLGSSEEVQEFSPTEDPVREKRRMAREFGRELEADYEVERRKVELWREEVQSLVY